MTSTITVRILSSGTLIVVLILLYPSPQVAAIPNDDGSRQHIEHNRRRLIVIRSLPKQAALRDLHTHCAAAFSGISDQLLD